MNKSERKQLRLAYIMLIIAGAISLAIIIWLAWVHPAQKSASIDSYQECVDAGYPIQEKYPPSCVTPDGKTFDDPAAQPVDDSSY